MLVKENLLGWVWDLFKTDKKKRMIMAIVSTVVMGFGILLLSLSGMGVDPYTSMNMSIAPLLRLGFGTWQMIVNFVLIAAVLLSSRRKRIGAGTVFNMVGVGFVCDFCKNILQTITKDFSLLGKLLLLLCGVVLLSFAASLFFTAGIGVGAYDALGFILEGRTKIKYKWCRVITDFAVIAVALLAAGMKNIGAGTVITAFCMGPLIHFFNVTVSERLLLGSGDPGTRKVVSL